MPGQYKQRRDRQVRADRRDDFGEIKQAYKVAKSGGGCWENIKSCLSLIILLTICGIITSILSGNTSAQSTQDSCYPHSTGYNNINTLIWAYPGYAEEKLGYLPIHSSFSVNESSEDASGNCWLRIDQGWIRDLHVLADKNAKPPPSSPTLNVERNTETEEEIGISTRCYTASKLYVTGSMNIRSGPSTGNSKVGSAGAGESFTVSSSLQKDDYCWLRISKGWIAKTPRVRSTKPPTYSPSSTNTVGLPRIQGGASFRAKVITAWNYLRDKSPKWFNYAISANFSVIQESWRTVVDTVSRRLEIERNVHGYRSQTSALSSILIHEACHVYQWNQGRSHSLSRRQKESECYQKQVDALLEYAPHERSLISEFRRGAANPPHVTSTGWWSD